MASAVGRFRRVPSSVATASVSYHVLHFMKTPVDCCCCAPHDATAAVIDDLASSLRR